MTTEKLPFEFDLKLPQLISLQAGTMQLSYKNGKLRSIRAGETEILRMIYIAVRDHNWSTADCTISKEETEIRDDGFSISYHASYFFDGPAVFEASVSIRGTADNSIHFEMKGKALSSFKRNRIGICVHHPIRECAGKTASFVRPDGKNYQADFPELISPHQPFLDIREMKWEPANGLQAKLSFEGDVFETEDQRNWGDACYKTYSTPLSIPFPVQLVKGEVVEQSVVLRLKGDVRAEERKTTADPKTVELPLPAIGLQQSSLPLKIDESRAALLKNILFSACRCELNLAEPSWKSKWAECVSEARLLHTKLALVVHFRSEQHSEFQDLLSVLTPEKDLLHSLLPLIPGKKVTPPTLLEKLYPVFKKELPALKIGYGTNAWFTELNRNRPPSGLPHDFVSFSVTPQVHASDTRSIMENVEALPWIIKTASSFAGDKEIYVSPLTLKRRFNPDAGASSGFQQPETADDRQQSQFLALFTAHAIAGCAGADLLFLYETLGEKGIFPEKARLADEGFPVSKLLQKLKDFRPVKLIRQDPPQWDSPVIFENGDGRQLRTGGS